MRVLPRSSITFRPVDYSPVFTPLIVTLDGATVFTLDAVKITDKWTSYKSPKFPVTAGQHKLGFVLGEGDGMDLIDAVSLHFAK